MDNLLCFNRSLLSSLIFDFSTKGELGEMRIFEEEGEVSLIDRDKFVVSFVVVGGGTAAAPGGGGVLPPVDASDMASSYSLANSEVFRTTMVVKERRFFDGDNRDSPLRLTAMD